MMDPSEDEELVRVPTSALERAIAFAAGEHLHATSTVIAEGVPPDGHKDFIPHLDDPQGPAVECAVCYKRLPLPL